MRFFVLTLAVCTFLFLTVPVDIEASSEPSVQAAVLSVNVNTASASELQRLPGIGKVTAQNIIDYRTEKGEFSSPEDLLKVKGIGSKTLEGIRDQIAVN